MTRENFMNRFNSIRAGMGMLKRAAVLALVTTVAGCTAGGPATTQTQQTTPGQQTATYNGPAANNADVTAFQTAFWVNVRASGSAKCGNCHSQTGGQSPMFARDDNVNDAYDIANKYVNFSTPDQSTFVLKAATGHNCWLADASACRDTMLTWIKNWIGTSGSSTSSGPPLETPPSSDVGSGKQFPASSDAFKTTVYPLLGQFCSGCHTPSSGSPQTPYFAAGGTPGLNPLNDPNLKQADVDAAYAAAQAKINLNTPDQSRFVVRLRDEHHNCWTTAAGPSDCDGSYKAMLAAITTFADGITATPVDTALVLSRALKLKDGTIASGGNRSEANLIAKYEFKGSGTDKTAFDTSGVAPAADLLFSGDVTWAGGWGINIGAGGLAKALTATSAKIATMVTATGEFSIETWAAPANVAQTNAWIVSYSGSDKTRNVTLGQSALKFQGAVRSDKTDANGGVGTTKVLLTDSTKVPVQASLQHIVLTYDPVNGQKLYVNGVDTGAKDPNPAGGSLASWDNTFALVLGAETTGKEQWLGTIKFVAIHSRALTKDQIVMNYNAGVGERYFLLFDVTDLTGVPQSYVEFTGAQLDSYAYQFSAPTFVSLNPNAVVGSVPLKGIRIGVNGVELPTGQSYSTVNTTITASGQSLSGVGAVVAADKGVDSDMFFLTFEQIGSHAHAHTEPTVPVAATKFPDVLPPRKGVKTFAQINAALSAITGVLPANTPAVNTLYNTLQQSLPPTNDLGAFLASHQTAISALADQYCNVAVNTNTAAMFPGLNLNNGNAATYFGNQANINLVADPLVARALGTNVNPTVEAAVRAELNSLLPTLAATNSTMAGRTASITQAACTAVLGSAAVSFQ
jgi:Concanavalin A-like lectin/glucanases superfamily